MSTHKLFSAITGAVEGMLNLNEEEQSISSPITGRKHYIVDPDNPIPTGTIVTQPNPTLSYNSTTGEVTASYTPVAGVVQDTAEKSATLQLSPQGGNTVLLMHFNSSLGREGLLADGGIITERVNSMDAEMGGSAESWTPTFDTGEFGNAILFDGSNQSEDPEMEEWYNHKLTLPVSADILTDDFTIEFWYKALGGWDNTGAILTATSGNTINFIARGGGATQTIDAEIGNGTSWLTATTIAAISPAINAWHHVAFVRNENTCIVYIDGAQHKSFDCSSFSAMTKNAMLSIGNLGSRFYGLIDELRVSKIARYTEAFTPPTEPFTVD